MNKLSLQQQQLLLQPCYFQLFLCLFFLFLQSQPAAGTRLSSSSTSSSSNDQPMAPPTFSSGFAFSRLAELQAPVKPWLVTIDPAPLPSIEHLDETCTEDEIVEALQLVVGKEGGVVMNKYRPQSTWLWRQWYGTVLYNTIPTVMGNMFKTFFLCILMRRAAFGDYKIWELPSASSIMQEIPSQRGRVVWQSLQNVDKIWKTLMSLTSFLLTFFVGQAFAFWRGVHDQGRAIQGRIQDLNMLMATSAARTPRTGTYTDEAAHVLKSLALKLRLFHLLFWASQAKRFRVLLTDRGLERMVEAGYLPRAEKERLDVIQLVPTQKHAAMLESAMRLCIEAVRNPRVIEYAAATRRSGSSSSSMSCLALENALLDQFCRLRAACGSIPDMVNARMPLAYTHFVQILVDSFLVLAPVAQYTDLGIFAVVLVGLLTLFYHGMLDLAKVFLDPLDNEDYCEGVVYLNLAVLIREANAASTRWIRGAAAV